jgi:hypothetical protein
MRAPRRKPPRMSPQAVPDDNARVVEALKTLV